MKVYHEIERSGSIADPAVSASVVVPLLLGVVFENPILTLLLPVITISFALYIKRVYFSNKHEWGEMLIRLLFRSRGYYTNAEKDF